MGPHGAGHLGQGERRDRGGHVEPAAVGGGAAAAGHARARAAEVEAGAGPAGGGGSARGGPRECWGRLRGRVARARARPPRWGFGAERAGGGGGGRCHPPRAAGGVVAALLGDVAAVVVAGQVG